MERPGVMVREALTPRRPTAAPHRARDYPVLAVDYTLDSGLIIREATAGRYTAASWMPCAMMVDGPSRQGSTRAARLARRWNLCQLEGEPPRLYRGTDRTSINVVDLFCGCGGFSLGVRHAIEAVGLRPVFRFAADLSSAALDVYAANLRPLRKARQNVELLLDYRLRAEQEPSLPDLTSVELSSELCPLVGCTDVLLAGPPCEGNSNLNNRTRRTDDRNELYLDAVVAGIALDAKVIVIENVPAVRRSSQDVLTAPCAFSQRAAIAFTRTGSR